MKPSPKSLTIADLEELMLSALASEKMSPEFQDGYLASHRRAGWLRPNCPAWIRDSAGVHYALPTAGMFQKFPTSKLR